MRTSTTACNEYLFETLTNNSKDDLYLSDAEITLFTRRRRQFKNVEPQPIQNAHPKNMCQPNVEGSSKSPL